jgi:AcrR family transcriptional regulator
VEELFWERPGAEPTLAEVAERAGVSVHSVIRRYGGRDGAATAAIERGVARVIAQRDQATPGDLKAAIAVLIDHYEEMGDRVVAMLAAEVRVPALKPIADRGRDAHAAWCERVFAPSLVARTGANRRRLLAQLIAICDVQTWRLLRRERRLGRSQTETALREMAGALIGAKTR